MRKTERQALIKTLISEQKITTQEQLTKSLLAKGVEVTQATASRDMKEMMLVKVPDESGIYYYITSQEQKVGLPQKNPVLRHTVRNIVSNELMVIVHTVPGGANTVALAVDNMQMPEILGTIAGDDTVFLALRDRECIEYVKERLADL